MQQKARPLDGIRVLEVGQLLAGPFTGSILAHLEDHPIDGCHLRQRENVDALDPELAVVVELLIHPGARHQPGDEDLDVLADYLRACLVEERETWTADLMRLDDLMKAATVDQ